MSRVIGEWLVNGRAALPPSAAPARPADLPAGITVTKLIDAFLTHAATHYADADRKPGREKRADPAVGPSSTRRRRGHP